jgi:hypothetical protein
MGLAGSDVLGVALCPLGITIGVAGVPSWSLLLSPPLFVMSFGGQDKSVGGQLVFSLDPPVMSLLPPRFVTSLVLLLLLLLSARAVPAEAIPTTAANTAATATRQTLFIA